MPHPPFDVSIRVELKERGVNHVRPLAKGFVDGPSGRPVQVSLGVQSAVTRDGETDESHAPMRFGLSIGDQEMVIDVTDMLERIAREYFRRVDPPPRTLAFKRRR